jgi:HD-like signal output (HDOD) protein
MSSQIARDIVRRSTAVAPSPSLIRLEAQLRGGDASAAELAHLIQGSPALAALVLRMANSVFYSPREPVVALSRAIVVLGDAVLRQVVLHSFMVGRRAAARRPGDAVAAARLMGDAVRSGVVARRLAHSSGAVPPDEAFVAGLLHDIGHLLLLDERPGLYADYLRDRRPEDTLDTELALTATTHEAVGAAFAAAWNLPMSLGNVLASHHDEVSDPLAAIVRASDHLVPSISRPGHAWEAVGAESLEAVLGTVGVKAEAWMAGMPRLRDELSDLLTVFAVAP